MVAGVASVAKHAWEQNAAAAWEVVEEQRESGAAIGSFGPECRPAEVESATAPPALAYQARWMGSED